MPCAYPPPCPWCLNLCLVSVPVCPCPMSVFRVRSAASPVFVFFLFNFFLVTREQKPVRGPIYATYSTMHLCPYPRPPGPYLLRPCSRGAPITDSPGRQVVNTFKMAISKQEECLIYLFRSIQFFLLNCLKASCRSPHED